MLACGVSLESDARADQPDQARALRRFVNTTEVTSAVGARIEAMRRLVLDHAAQHDLAEADTGLVDIGWTGRMAASLIGVCEAAGMSRPHVLFWGHEPRPATRWTDPERVASSRQRPGRDRDTSAGPAIRLEWPGYPRRSCMARGITRLEHAGSGPHTCGTLPGMNSPALPRRIYTSGLNDRMSGPFSSVADVSDRHGLHAPGLYFPVAALNLTTSSAGTRPRSFTSMP